MVSLLLQILSYCCEDTILRWHFLWVANSLGSCRRFDREHQYTAYVFRCYLSVSASTSVSPVLLSFKASSSAVSLLSPIDSLVVKYILSWCLSGDCKLGSCHDLYQSYSKYFLQYRQERRAKGRLLLEVSEGERTQLGWRAVGKALQS